jgi:hypothetical protein
MMPSMKPQMPPIPQVTTGNDDADDASLAVADVELVDADASEEDPEEACGELGLV